MCVLTYRGVSALQALVAQPEEADLVAADDVVVAVGSPPAVRRLLRPGRRPVVAVAGAIALDDIEEVDPRHPLRLEREVLDSA